MKKNLLSIVAVLMAVATYAQNYNMVFRDSLHYNGTLSNIGGIAINGDEYALVGWEHGLSIVNVSNPDSVYEVINVPGLTSEWREVKTWNNHAYVTTEAFGSLQIINLNYLPDSAPVKVYNGDGAIQGQLETIHALHIDAGFCYLFGTNIGNGQAIILDISNPWFPTYVGETPGSYIHDGYVRNDTLWAGHIYDGYFAIYDVSNKSNPILINQQTTPGKFTHNTWLNDAGNVLFTTDEVSNSVIASYDVSDPNNIQLLDEYKTAGGQNAIVHNTHTLNDYQVASYYTEGIVIVDNTMPDNLIEVGKYDTSPDSGSGFHGAWGVYPFLPSGNIVVSDMEEGLIVLTPTYQRACYLQGIITDSTTGASINKALLKIIGTNATTKSDVSGKYKTGWATPGTYDVEVSAFGYITKTVQAVVLANGLLTLQDVALAPGANIVLSGQVFDSTTMAGVPNAKIKFTTGANEVDVVTDINGYYTLQNFVPAMYEVTVQMWGYKGYCQSGVNVMSAPLNFGLNKGYYDDFTFDWGWSTNSTVIIGAWERGEPMGTYFQTLEINPEEDVQSDCGVNCFATGNGTTDPFGNFVYGGYTELTSPVFDGTSLVNPELHYSRWFFDYAQPGTANDSLWVRIDNGTQVQTIELYVPGNTLAQWEAKSFLLAPIIPLTSSMKVSFYVSNYPGVQDVCEAAIDLFEVVSTPLGINDNPSYKNSLVFPNPFTNTFTISTSQLAQGLLQVQMFNTQGIIAFQSTIKNSGSAQFTPEVSAGVYLVRVIDENGKSQSFRVCKQ